MQWLHWVLLSWGLPDNQRNINCKLEVKQILTSLDGGRRLAVSTCCWALHLSISMKCQKLVECKKRGYLKVQFVRIPSLSNTDALGCQVNRPTIPKCQYLTAGKPKASVFGELGMSLQIGPLKCYNFMTSEQMLSADEDLMLRLQYDDPE